MARKKNKKKGRKKARKPRFFFRFLKICFVLGLWGLIIGGLITAWYASELPKIIDTPQFERQAAIRIKAKDQSLIGRYGELRGVSVTVEDLPPHMIYAVLAIEDRRFYQHYGIDPLGIARAMVVNIREGGIVQGGSTITQQLAKNLFLSHERTLKRKIQEALLALWLEKQLTKDEILSAYLNRVYLGSGAYGVDAAARLYFDKPATAVSLKEAALLAGLLKAPSRYSPQSNPKLARQRADTVLHAMKDGGYITEKSMETTHVLVSPEPATQTETENTVSYFTDWIVAGLDDFAGATNQDLTVSTTLDPVIQRIAEQTLRHGLESTGAQHNVGQGAVVVISYDGAIRAMVGGKNYSKSQFNRATQALRPPGSAFKPIVYYAALEQGKGRKSTVYDGRITEGEYRPENFKDEYFGRVSYETALAKSLNTATVRVAKETGLSPIIKAARTMGIEAPLSRDLSLALGSSGIPLLEMSTAYGMIANGGFRIRPYGITKIKTESGDTLYQRMALAPSKTALDSRAVKDLQSMLISVVDDGTGKRAALDRITTAGKTGTSQNFRDAWFIGYTPDYITAVWLGNDDNSPMKQVTGGTLPAQIWHSLMNKVYKQKTFASSPPPTKPVATIGNSFRSLIDNLLNGQ